MKIPINNQWKQNNYSDRLDSIYGSFGLDLTSNVGSLRTNRTLSVANSSDLSGLGLAGAFKFLENKYYAATTGQLAQRLGTDKTGSWTLNSTSGNPTTIDARYSDLELFNSTLRVSVSGSTHYIWDGSAWTNFNWSNAVANRRHNLLSYADVLYNTIDYAKIEGIASPATSNTVIATLDLGDPLENTITFLRKTSSKIWIGTMNQTGGKATIYTWDGTQTTPNESYILESTGAMAGVVKDDVLHIVDNDGRLLAFNGGTFVELDRLPIDRNKYLINALEEGELRWIHPNGMDVCDGRILILINNEYRGATPTHEERVPSGVWEYTKETGLYHKYSPSFHKAISGTLSDYGQNSVSSVGALAVLKSISTVSTDNGLILAGAQLYTTATVTQNHILIDDSNNTIQKYSYIVTPKIFSNKLEDMWKQLYVRNKKLLDSADQITVKYRVDDEEPTSEVTIAWATDNTVTTTSDLSNYEVGDEMEVTQGTGSGKTAHIASIEESGGTYTVILDDSFLNVGGTSKARFQKWKKAETRSDQSLRVFQFNINRPSPWVQIKICMQFKGKNEVQDLTLNNQNNE